MQAADELTAQRNDMVDLERFTFRLGDYVERGDLLTLLSRQP